MGDIIDMAIKEFDGKRVDVDAVVIISDSVVETTIVTKTASGGHDMYLGKASVRVRNTGGSAFNMTGKLYMDTDVVETITASNLAQGDFSDINFKTIGDKVIATKVIKITVTNSTDVSVHTSTNEGKLMLWEEVTNETPEIT